MDTVSAEKRSKIMSAIRSRDTRPEIAVRKWLFAHGYRFRVCDRHVPGHPDVVLPRLRTLIEVRGCFWHHHGWEWDGRKLVQTATCPQASAPKSNRPFWNAKFRRNVRRDQEHEETWLATGWNVIVVWECALRTAADRERTFAKVARWLSEIEGRMAHSARRLAPGALRVAAEKVVYYAPMKVFREPGKLQKWAKARRLAGAKVALVPTMGALHEGHLSLIRKARSLGADEIVVSVFVNPVQFGPNEDYEKYPRREREDLAKCRAAGATAVFFPTPANMYLDRHSVYVVEEDLSKGLCGARRPGHFRGVCTVVAKLFNLAHPDFAVFGQKDYQQAQVIRRMARDLNFDIKVVIAPIVREPSGLARSSRNAYLSDDERERATALSRTLAALRDGRLKTTSAAAKAIEKAGLKVDYVECVDAETLEPRRKVAKGCCVLVAAYCGKTRLIDNALV